MKKILSFYHKHIFCLKTIALFGLFICIGGGLSILFGQDVHLDLQNYHLYNPYALLTGRFGWDLFPAGNHTFFNPLLDVPYYLLFTSLNEHPLLTAFIQGAWYGAFLFLAWQLCKLFFPAFGTSQAKLLRLAVFMGGVTGVATLSQIGRATNEVQLAVINLAATWLLLQKKPEEKKAVYSWACAAFLTCAAAGLKYTAFPAAFGLGAAGFYLWVRYNRSWRALTGCIGAGMTGFALTNGYFLWRNWKAVGNPFFPYFNHLFKSSFFASENLANGVGTPGSFWDMLVFPWVRSTSHFAEFYCDWRIMLGVTAVLVLFFVWAFYWIIRKPAMSRQLLSSLAPLLDNRFFSVLLIFVGTYITWMPVFGVMRYSIVVEFFGFVVLSALIYRWKGPILSSVFIALLALGLVLNCPRLTWYRSGWQQKNYVINIPSIPDNAVVLVIGHISYLLPFANPKAKYVGGIYFHASYFSSYEKKSLVRLNFLAPKDYQHNYQESILKTIQQTSGDIYMLAPNTPLLWKPSIWERYGVALEGAGKNCKFFNSSIDVVYGGFVLCRVNKV